jgi:hypothetical protein
VVFIFFKSPNRGVRHNCVKNYGLRRKTSYKQGRDRKISHKRKLWT